MKLARRALIALTAAAFCAVPLAHAEWAPKRPINVIVPYKAGGGTDLYARAIAAAADKALPVPVVIVNKPGAGGVTGALEASKARADGSTILMHSAGSFLLGHMFKGSEPSPFDDFQTVAQIGNLVGAVMVPADSPYKTVGDLAEAIKAAPGSLRWAHNGRGGTFHVLGQSFLNEVKAEATDVPFKGGSAGRAAVVGSQVDFGFMGVQLARGFDNEMRVLAVADDERSSLFPDVPTFAEAGIAMPNISSPIIVFAPRGTDEDIVKGMEAAFKTIAEAPEFAETVTAKGTFPVYRDAAGAEATLRELETGAKPVIDALK